MKHQNQKKDQNKLYTQQRNNPQNFVKGNQNEAYMSYFYRNLKQNGKCSPSQSFQTNKLSKTKSKLKQTRVKSKNPKCLYYQLETTKKSEIQLLRDENAQLKKNIADLKISQLYQIDQNKIKKLLIQIDQLKMQVKRYQRQNQKLKLQNDFLNRSYHQIKLQLNKTIKKQAIPNTNKLQSEQYQDHISQIQKKRGFTPKTSMQLPQYLIFGMKRSDNFMNYDQSKTKTSFGFFQGDPQVNMPSRNQKQLQLVRMSSQKFINPRIVSSQKRKNKKKDVYTQFQGQNNQIYQHIK